MHRSLVHAAGTATLIALLLSGCSAADTPAATHSASPSATSTPVASPTPTPTGAGTTPAAPPAATPPAEPQSAARCEASALTGTIEAGAGGAAGSSSVELVLTNSGANTCELQGWPGVSFVGKGNGTQLGSAAAQDRSPGTPHGTVSIAPGHSAAALLTITDAANIPAEDCGPVDADGLRIYPPGSKQALFVPYPTLQACTSAKADLLKVAALQPRA